MNEQTGFSVELIIKNIKFLIPVEVELDVINSLTGSTITNDNKIKGSINLIDKEFHPENKEDIPEVMFDLFKKKLFEFLNKNSIREDQFELDDEIYNQASKAQSEHDNLHKTNVEG